MLPATLRQLARLLSQPDEPSLVGRGHRLTHRGAEDRWERVYLPLLMHHAVRRHDRAEVGPGRHFSARQTKPALRFVKK
jgi:hypothetical protein